MQINERTNHETITDCCYVAMPWSVTLRTQSCFWALKLDKLRLWSTN